jgi:hypothetical protein
MTYECDRLLSLYVVQYPDKQKDDDYILDELIMESFPEIDKKKDYEGKNRNRYNVIYQTDAGLFKHVGL